MVVVADLSAGLLSSLFFRLFSDSFRLQGAVGLAFPMQLMLLD